MTERVMTRGKTPGRRLRGGGVAIALVAALIAAACGSGGPEPRSADTSTAPAPDAYANDFADLQALMAHREVEPLMSATGGETPNAEMKGLDPLLHQDSAGRTRDDLYRDSIKSYRSLEVDRGTPAERAAAYGGNALQWRSIGSNTIITDPSIVDNGQKPGPNAGAAFDLAIDPNGTSDQTLFAAFDGGIWRTTNGGQSWTPLTDNLATTSFGAVVQDVLNPSVVYAGTGNPFNQGYFEALGIYRSTNLGNTWTLTPGSAVFNGVGINKMLSLENGMLLVATTRGLYSTLNNGVSFSRVALAGWDVDAYVTDLDRDPADPARIYASVEGLGIFRSDDRGFTFGTNVFGSGGGPNRYSYRFLSMAAQGNSLYATTEASNNFRSGLSTNTVTDTIVSPGPHGLSTNRALLFTNSPPSTALQTFTWYYAIVLSTTSFRIASAPGDPALDLIGANRNGLAAVVDTGSTSSNVTTNTFTQVYPHDLVTGRPIKFGDLGGATGTTGININTQYWAIVTSPTAFQVASSYNNALSSIAIDLTGSNRPVGYSASGLHGIWQSQDGGSTWNQRRQPAFDTVFGLSDWRQMRNCQCGYDQTIGIDPVNSNVVYVGFQDLWRSTDGANTFTNVTTNGVTETMHVDHHSMAFSPPADRTPGDPTTRIWAGNDGGIYSSDDGGTTWTVRNSGLATNLYRGIDTGKGATGNQYTYGGMQDTGSAVKRPGLTNNRWYGFTGGDGGYASVDSQDAKKAFVTWGPGNIYRTADAGVTKTWMTWLPCASDGSMTPAIDPNNGAITYFPRQCSSAPAGSAIFRSTNRGDTLTRIYTRPDLPLPNNGSIRYRITSMAMSPQNSDVLWVGYSDGSVARITALDQPTPSVQIFTPRPTPSGQAARVTVNPTNADHAVAVFGGYTGSNFPFDSYHVLETRDGGTTWNPIGGSVDPAQLVPDMPVYDAVIDPNAGPAGLGAVLVATDAGVLRTVDGGITWQVLGTGLPTVNVVDLAIDHTVKPSVIKAGTYGRSVWQLSRPPTPKADYRFNGNLTTSVAAATTPALTNDGAGTSTFPTVTVDGVSRKVRQFTQGRGLRLAPSTAVVTNNGNYTISMLFKLTDVSGWRRLIDTTNGTSENGLYVNEGRLVYWPENIAGPNTFAADEWTHVVLVRNATTNQFLLYLNGVKQLTLPTNAEGTINPTDGIRFFRDDNGEESAGSVARIRVYNSALNDFDAKNLDRLPVTGPPTPTSASPNELNPGSTNVAVTISGTNFTPNTTVSIPDGISVQSVTYVNSTQVRAVVNVNTLAFPGPREVFVTTDLGSGTCNGCITVT